MRVLDLFAGIGGFSLAAHWMGWETVQFVEWEKYPQKVLAKNFPGVPIHGDIKTYKGEKYAADIVCGGFPCQPFSRAGARKGQSDDRYLWPEMLRVIREVQPTWVIGENVAGLANMVNGNIFEKVFLKMAGKTRIAGAYHKFFYHKRQFGVLKEIIESLEKEGYAVQIFNIPAIAKGAPHKRERLWIVAYSNNNHARRKPGELQGQDEQSGLQQREPMDFTCAASEMDTIIKNPHSSINGKLQTKRRNGVNGNASTAIQMESLADADGKRLEKRQSFTQNDGEKQPPIVRASWGQHWYEVATRLCRMDAGLPAWVDADRTPRLKALGNSIVPQVVYEIFKAIEEVENQYT